MTQLEWQGPVLVSPQMDAEQIKTNIRKVARRQWSLWSCAVMVTILLAIGIASFAFPGLLSQTEQSVSLLMISAIRGLVGLVLLFNVYTVYQQLQINRIHKQLGGQIEALGRMEVRTDEVYRLALLDPLTGLHNRRSGEQRLVQEISSATRSGRPLTILAMDIDNLKQVNDTFGHAAGDELIRRFAERLSRAIRGSDSAIRLGGDEFLILLPECKPEDGGRVLDRLHDLKIECSGQFVDVSFSVGWANLRSGDSLEELLKRADDALYANKRSSRQLHVVSK